MSEVLRRQLAATEEYATEAEKRIRDLDAEIARRGKENQELRRKLRAATESLLGEPKSEQGPQPMVMNAAEGVPIDQAMPAEPKQWPPAWMRGPCPYCGKER